MSAFFFDYFVSKTNLQDTTYFLLVLSGFFAKYMYF